MDKNRKKENVENYLRTTYKGDTLLGDVFLYHNSLPELNFDDIDTKSIFLGKTIDYPIIINAMTGGSDFSQEINGELSLLAKEFNIPMAVGSQALALCDEEGCRESFRIARENVSEDGIIIANLGGQASLEDAKIALDIVKGDALQLHLNPARQIVMVDGNRNFEGILKNIETIVKGIDKPVIVKEVGFGISKEVASQLYNVGVRNIDISGSGGTNFIEIENMGHNTMDFSELYSWGVPTALSLIKCRELPEDLNLIASGGIKDSIDIVKALVLGGSIVGISGELLLYLLHGGQDNARNYLENLIYKMKVMMLLLGKKNIQELRTANYKTTGKLKDLI